MCLQYDKSGFDPWVGKIPWGRERRLTPVFQPEGFHRLSSPWGCKESDMTEQLSLSLTVAKNLWTASYCLLWLPLAFSHILIHKILIIWSYETTYLVHRFTSPQLSSVVSNSFRSHGLEHARLPRPAPTPGACSNSSPLSLWCHPTISSSVVPLLLSCFFDDSINVGNLISGSSAFSKTSLSIWKFMVHVLLKPGLENFEHYFASVGDACNCVVVWTIFGIAFFVIGMKTDLFQFWGHCWVFQICWHVECNTSTASSFGIWNSSTGIP